MKRLVVPSIAILGFVIGAFVGFQTGCHPPISSGKVYEEDMQFYSIEDLQAAVKNSLGDPPPAETAKAIRIDWIIASATVLAKDHKYMHFVVERVDENGAWKIMDPKAYRLYAEGFDDKSQYGAAEQFPPGMWP